MPKISKTIKFTSQNEHVFEHVFEHNLLLKKKFTAPKFYTANNDLTKRWYIYFSFRNPETGRLQRMKNFYGYINKFKTKEGRMKAISTYGDMLEELLNAGYNPFDDNTDYLQLLEKHANNKSQQKTVEETTITNSEPRTTSKSTSIPDKKVNPTIDSQKEVPTIQQESTKDPNSNKTDSNDSNKTSLTIEEAFTYVLKLKEKTVSKRTVKDYSYKLTNFKSWIETNYPELEYIDRLTKKHFSEYLNEILIKSSARNRNNYRTELSAIFQTLQDNDIVHINELTKIKKLKSIPSRHKRYSQEQQEEIFEYLEKNDSILLLYIKFVSYGFLRPIEVIRLKIKDVDIKNKQVQYLAKSGLLKTKIIPDILFKELPDISDINPDYFLFTPNKIGGNWNSIEITRRDNFSKRFNKVVKKHFELDKNFSIYSFRHTSITKIYRELLKSHTPFEAKSKLMLISGHSSMTALEKYLRDIDAELPKDYSNLLIT